MNDQQLKVWLRFLKALADESRLKILGILANQECSVEELATLLNLKEPTVSHHLTKLKQLDLVKMQVEGNVHLYQINLETLQAFGREIFTLEKMASLVQDLNTEVWDIKVLKAVIEGDFDNPDAVIRLREIPTNRQKRLVVLKWLVCHLEVGVSYTETEIDEFIQRFHPDYVTLRQELLGLQLLVRDNGNYMRSPQFLP
ncbi:DUF2087 domain-containing protein [Calothrix sp. NIES-3974]|uniref:DUF2087 domain-containing protein n=1 Tax=Calothrix sp. NIES-3974 TaxID=2005462 RepID=UPI000B5ECA37|nr:metalloregulator ArsR/SmtB family transcription factor [Calothrix sp. NIES-3974]BAZ05993.1 ArsR family transcriptional regulator [Calothrix sp. NIES-3974]